ncbi:MAG: hypothetical protein JRI91_15440 [Deltaproteobacteria bacterium]|nr:hypothetical protein [Deltaproteobacteria bacterium]
MVWIEEIKLRTALNKEEKAFHYLMNAVLHMKNIKGLIRAKVLIHAFLTNDFSLLLVWDTDALEDLGSEEGMNLREVLKQFGLVNYDVWIEEK